MVKIYLAGSCAPEQRNLMVAIAKYLRTFKNIGVYCPFELEVPNAWDISQEEWSEKVFMADKDAIDNCDVFLMVSQGRISSAGTNWEQGYAYGIGKYIGVIQITDTPTSLMTYSSADCFCNVKTDGFNIDEVAVAIEKILLCYEKPWVEGKGKCLTVLT